MNQQLCNKSAYLIGCKLICRGKIEVWLSQQVHLNPPVRRDEWTFQSEIQADLFRSRIWKGLKCLYSLPFQWSSVWPLPSITQPFQQEYSCHLLFVHMCAVTLFILMGELYSICPAKYGSPIGQQLACTLRWGTDEDIFFLERLRRLVHRRTMKIAKQERKAFNSTWQAVLRGLGIYINVL